MDRENVDRLLKGSVRSLPPGQLQTIRRMFEQSGQSDGRVSTVYETKDTEMARDITPERRWRQHLSPPSTVTRRYSDTAAASVDTSVPLRPTTHKNSQDKGQGLANLPINKFGEIASRVALASDNSAPCRVSRVREQFEQKDAKVPLKPKPQSPSRGRIKSPKREGSPARPTKKSPIPLRRSLSSKSDTDNQTVATNFEQKGQLSIPGYNNDQRSVSVSERSKMFENISGNVTSSPPVVPSLSKPDKPPPPLRQRSSSGGESSDIKTSSQGKPNPPRPPMRQRSVIETESGNDLDTGGENESDKTEVDAGKPPAPPSKPKRTGAHDDYIKVKLEKEAELQRIKLQEAQDQTCDNPESTQTGIDSDKTVRNLMTQRPLPEIPSVTKKKKPTRPPPPRKKPRPFSIATDAAEFMSSEGSDSDDVLQSNENKENTNLFYEVIPAELLQDSVHKKDLKHWDLPRASHPEPIRRSLSAECVQKAVDDEGNILYMEPEKLIGSEDRGYDIYVDSEGYAVPNRLIRLNKDMNDATEYCSGWQIISEHAHDNVDSGGLQSSPGKPIGDRVKSKFRRFKGLFKEQEKPGVKPPGQHRISAPDRGSQKKKIDAIRLKVNQAFEVLHPSPRRRKESETVDAVDDEEADKLSNDSDSRVDEKEIRKRVEYSRSIRLKTSRSIRETKKLQKKVYPQMFEHAMIVGLQQNVDTGVYEPYTIYKFPEIRNYKLTMEGKLYPCSDSKDSNVSVPLFCFPDAANFKPSSSSSKSQTYNFVLTNIDGGRVYGYCRRLIPPKSPQKIPEVICIISPVDAFSMYNTLLEEVEQKRLVSLDAAQELIAAAFGRPLPSPGQSEIIRTLDEHGEMETLFITRDTDNRIENVNCECLLTHLGSDKLLKVFATILMERSVLFCAKHLSTLSSTINAIVSLLYPFSWQHTFIPVLPMTMIDVVCSPAPYIMGITTSILPKTTDLPIEDNVLIVDIDKRSFIKSLGDEGTLLPKKIEKALKTSLNMCRVDAEAKESPNVMISEAFLRFFIEAIGHYGNYIVEQDGKYIFQKEEFTKEVASSTLQQLLVWFVETQMFEVFITKQEERKDWGSTIAYFESRLQEHLFTKGQKRRLGKKSSAFV